MKYTLVEQEWGEHAHQLGQMMVLNSPRAVQITIYVVRAFVKVRESLAAHTRLARELAMLKSRVDSLDTDTRKQFDQVYEAILGLMGSGQRKS